MLLVIYKIFEQLVSLKSQKRSLLTRNRHSFQKGVSLNGYRHIGNKRLTMDQSEKFSDYLFAKMGPPIIGNNDNECPRKTTDSCEAPVELTGFRKWFSENLMLLVTLSGVLFGVILGKFDELLHLSVETYHTIWVALSGKLRSSSTHINSFLKYKNNFFFASPKFHRTCARDVHEYIK